MNESAEPKRLYRSTNDRVLAGVCGGLGRYFGLDPIVVRVAAIAGLFLGGVTLVAYIAALVLVPSEPAEGAPAPPPGQGRSAGAIALIAVALLIASPILLGGGLIAFGIGFPLAILALMGLLAWWLVSGEGPGGEPKDVARRAALGLGVLLGCSVLFFGGAWIAGIGSGTVAAGLVIGSGVVLVIAAFLGGARLVALPALALALGVGLVSASGIDLDGGVGEREYRPASAADLRDRYELGMGELVVDLRETDLPPGDTPLDLRVGVGEVRLIVPRDVCVASTADIGVGHVDVLGRESDGVDVDWEDSRRPRTGGKRLVVQADIGMGEFAVRHDGGFDGSDRRFGGSDRRFGEDDGVFGGRSDGDRDQAAGNTACARGDGSAGA